MHSSAELRRRDLVRSGAAVGAAAVIPGLLAGDAAAQEEATTDSDLELLLGLIVLAQGAVVAYEALAARDLLGPDTEVARAFGAQEQEHVNALIAELAKIEGGPPPPAPQQEDIPGLSEVTARGAGLEFAVGVENQAVAAYLDAMRGFENPDLQTAAARIVGNSGEHLVVWRAALGREPVPSAFPTGSEKI